MHKNFYGILCCTFKESMLECYDRGVDTGVRRVDKEKRQG